MQDRVVLITGASRGLGAAIARCLDAAGCNLVLTARSREALEDLASQCSRAMVVSADLAENGAAPALVEATVKEYGRLDALIHNAGVLGPLDRLAEADPQSWEHNLRVNLLAPMLLTRAALPHLRHPQGRIVHISTGAAVKPMEGWSAYCTSKAGLLHLSSVIAAEEPEVTSLSLRPGVIDTAMQTEIREQGQSGMTEEKWKNFVNLKEQGQLEPPEVPARVAAWLALFAPRQWSGEFLQYTDERVSGPAKEWAGSL
ncbi:MAG: SDR family NAD(P)-dependent oxidoreductase [Vulcanimicrobiota bacterium]